MAFYTEELEKCDICYKLVSTCKQTRGVCHECMKKMDLASCSECGELFRWEDLTAVGYECPKCKVKK